MKKGRFKRNKYILLSGVVIFILCLCFNVTPSKINNYVDIMSASLSFSALATAMFFSLFSLIPAFSNSKFIIALKKLKTDQKIMDRLLISTIMFFISSILSFAGLFFMSTENCFISNLVTALWASFTIMPLINTILILIIVLKGFDYYTMEDKSK